MELISTLKRTDINETVGEENEAEKVVGLDGEKLKPDVVIGNIIEDYIVESRVEMLDGLEKGRMNSLEDKLAVHRSLFEGKMQRLQSILKLNVDEAIKDIMGQKNIERQMARQLRGKIPAVVI